MISIGTLRALYQSVAPRMGGIYDSSEIGAMVTTTIRCNQNFSTNNLDCPQCQANTNSVLADSKRFFREKRIQFFGFALCLLIIGGISAHDTQMAIENEEIAKVEKNPICLSLINLDPDGFRYFVLGKSIGTLMVISMLCTLAKFQYRHAKLVTLSIVVFQLGLLVYLHLSDPRIGGLPNLALLLGDYH
jgi:hypothetical protein